MADFIFNVARGRTRFYYDAVDSSLVLASAGAYTTGAGNALLVVGIDAAGTTDDTLKDFDDLAALLAGTPNEVTATNYARKVLIASDLAASAQNDGTNVLPLDIPDQTWTGVVSAGGNPNFTDLIVCFRPLTASADSAIIPLTCHDFPITTDGSDVVGTIAAAGFYGSA